MTAQESCCFWEKHNVAQRCAGVGNGQAVVLVDAPDRCRGLPHVLRLPRAAYERFALSGPLLIVLKDNEHRHTRQSWCRCRLGFCPLSLEVRQEEKQLKQKHIVFPA